VKCESSLSGQGLKNSEYRHRQKKPELNLDRETPNASGMIREFFEALERVILSGVRRLADNALTEGFYWTVKQEEIHLVGNYPDENSARKVSLKKTRRSHGFNEVDDRRDDKGTDVGSDEIEQNPELRQTFQVSLQTEKKYHELAQEQTHQPDEREQNETRPAFVSDGSIGGESGK
jgi:hypothetical protein